VEFTDHFVDRVARRALEDKDPVVRSLAQSTVYRRPPKLLLEASALVDTTDDDQARHNAAAAFMRSCKERIPQLAKQHKVDLRSFLLAETRPIRLEKRGAVIPASEARGQPPEKEDELIKVFVPHEPEPRSLVEVPASIVRPIAGYAARATRLYVVEEDEAKLRKLRAAVENW
jgi:hypothetical protein